VPAGLWRLECLVRRTIAARRSAAHAAAQHFRRSNMAGAQLRPARGQWGRRKAGAQTPRRAAEL